MTDYLEELLAQTEEAEGENALEGLWERLSRRGAALQKRGDSAEEPRFVQDGDAETWSETVRGARDGNRPLSWEEPIGPEVAAAERREAARRTEGTPFADTATLRGGRDWMQFPREAGRSKGISLYQTEAAPQKQFDLERESRAVRHAADGLRRGGQPLRVQERAGKGGVSEFSGGDERAARTVDREFRRDARRYDGEFSLY